MPTKSKQKAPRNVIVLGDIVFKLGVREVSGVIRGQQGLTCFISEEEGLAIPLSFNVPIEMYDEEVTAWVRTSDNSLVLELGADDVYVEELNPEDGEVDVTDPSVISDMFEEQKLRVVPQVITGIAYTLGAIVIAIIVALLKLPLFPALAIPACLGAWGLGWSAKWYSQLNRSIAYDAVGNWIDLSTGSTSLNDGTFKYHMEARK